ncbi:uncharacterized protein E5676_scaffold504G00280 [Cucumis melo var. makuwa]|uniref:Uncharacterized protein n=1 Tax=Cucumis melo var. makuwa TaxID=1194695 RepID=A0A5D3CDV8_CUCMM|nr:uncharacterized protein E5676_scaffold504G00280 [Cucumis melo var. makuwa]
MAMFRGRVMIIENQILQRLFVTIVIASTCDILEASVTISADEYAKFQNYQDSLQASSSSTPVASTVASAIVFTATAFTATRFFETHPLVRVHINQQLDYGFLDKGKLSRHIEYE